MAAMTKPSKRNYFQIIKLAGIVLIPAILFFLPYHFFDSNGPSCLFTLLSGYSCPGCGLTRACMRIIHFRFEEAYAFNKLSIFIFPVLAFLWAKEGWDTWKKIKAASVQEA
jgi:hypothetical protein